MPSPQPTTNRLIQESSPYLLQHAHNPVDWYPWGDKAFQKAIEEDKPILLSCGYSACHWCHVMEQESFADPGIAKLMMRCDRILTSYTRKPSTPWGFRAVGR